MNVHPKNVPENALREEIFQEYIKSSGLKFYSFIFVCFHSLLSNLSSSFLFFTFSFLIEGQSLKD